MALTSPSRTVSGESLKQVRIATEKGPINTLHSCEGVRETEILRRTNIYAATGVYGGGMNEIYLQFSLKDNNLTRL